MKYEIVYKTLMEIANLIEKKQNTTDYSNTDIFEDDLVSLVAFDIIIIQNDSDNSYEVLCSDKRTLDSIKRKKANNVNTSRYILTNLHKCFIIKYSDIIELMEYKEFCCRYNYKI